MSKDLLTALPALAPSEFAAAAYDCILRRPPTEVEREQMVTALLQGEAPTWLLGRLRYGEEGRARATDVPGLWRRYVAQRLLHLPIIGVALQWLNALVRLPGWLRYARALRQLDAERSARMGEDALRRLEQIGTRDAAAIGALARRLDGLRAELDQRHHKFREALAQLDDELHDALDQRLVALRANLRSVEGRHETLLVELESSATCLRELRLKVDGIFPPPLGDTLELPGTPLIAVARERTRLAPGIPVSSLSAAARYAMFETVFYESHRVAAKQRVYLPYLDRELAQKWPFLDLGCGRGEFLQILAGEGVRSIGVDINPTTFSTLRADGFDLVEQDILAFVESDRGTYCGASMLQVAEHLTHEQIERALELVIQRLAPGGVFILETPNPLSPLALSEFHTDHTHVAPLPPEAMRYAIEAAGFEKTRTLFQARVPRGQFAGPDPRAYYSDYAIIAWRPAT